MPKKLSPQALIALKDALIVIYWKKTDLRLFIENSFEDVEKGRKFCATLDFSNTKYVIVNEVVDRMYKRPDLYNNDLVSLCYNTCNMNDFSHLLIWDNGKEKAKIAKEKVAILQQQCKGYFDLQEERKLAEKRKQEYNKVQDTMNERKQLIQSLKDEFNDVISKDEQARGYAFEKFLNHIFAHYDLAPRGSFKTNGEQIDGAFTHNSTDYLLEAKWQTKLISLSDLYIFQGKIDSKLKNTIGLYVSFNGYSNEVLENFQAKAIILVDGQDLCQILEDRISLPDMIEAKRKEAATTGNVMYRINC